jgi:hypothetical protein
VLFDIPRFLRDGWTEFGRDLEQKHLTRNRDPTAEAPDLLRDQETCVTLKVKSNSTIILEFQCWLRALRRGVRISNLRSAWNQEIDDSAKWPTADSY